MTPQPNTAKKRAPLDVTRKIALEVEAAKELLSHISDDGDEELRADMIEGETNLFEVIGYCLNAIDDCEALAIGVKRKEEQFASRRTAIEGRIKRLRASIEQAMLVTNQGKVMLPSATLSLSKTAPKVVIEDEALIPSAFWKAGKPSLDKAALKDALKEEQPIEGATLSNGGISLNIRRI